MPSSASRLAAGPSAAPGAASPETSPFMSAANTGTPAADSCSVSSWRVLVLPVPVAPAIRPWRLTIDSGNCTTASGTTLPSCMPRPRSSAGPSNLYAPAIAAPKSAFAMRGLVQHVADRHTRDAARRGQLEVGHLATTLEAPDPAVLLVAAGVPHALLDGRGRRSDSDAARRLLGLRGGGDVEDLAVLVAEHVHAGAAVEPCRGLAEDRALRVSDLVGLAELCPYLRLRHVQVGAGDPALRDDASGCGGREGEGDQCCRCECLRHGPRA